jgi:feruloyl esterase
MIACFAALLLALAGSVRAAETACEDLAKLSLPHTGITAATLIAKSEFTPPPGAIEGCNPTIDCESGPTALYAAMPSFCRVQATLRPTANSDIRIEVWLPTAGWNGRLQAVGNSGFLSHIFYGNLALAEKLVDWSYRAVHEMTVTAKAIVAARYGTPAKYAYWNSCGTGGQQGLVEAERYPDDFDGVAVGDAADGVKDGLLSDPLACKFDPRTIQCTHGDREDCLTAPQIVALNTVRTCSTGWAS